MLRLNRHVRATVNRDGAVRRRDFFKGISLAGLAAGQLGWADMLSLQAAELRKRHRACIVLWMEGGPSQFETFSPKPGHENGGPTQAIDTNVPGIQIAENFPHAAQIMDQLAIVRSMTSKEGNHQRASFLMHTSYAPTASVKHPALGAVIAHEAPNPDCELPSFVTIGNTKRNLGGGGFLGVEYNPFSLERADELPQNSTPTTSFARYERRLGLLSRLEADQATPSTKQLVDDHQKLYAKTSRMIMSDEMRAFDISQEPAAVREAYGDTEFAAGCLLARRLVEAGVTCVEVQCRGWDTHNENFDRVRELADRVDQPFAQLVRDLQQRGLLDSTLVVWMGEFGRTPRVNARVGRDHYPRAFNVVLAGGGIRGGQVIGQTDEGGVDVTDRPVSVQDLFRSFCQSLRIDPETENLSPIGRPIKIVEEGESVQELFG